MVLDDCGVPSEPHVSGLKAKKQYQSQEIRDSQTPIQGIFQASRNFRMEKTTTETLFKIATAILVLYN